MRFFKKSKKFDLFFSAFIFIAAVIVFYKLITLVPSMLSWTQAFLSILSPFIYGFIISFLLYIPQGGLEKLLKKSKNKIIIRRARGISVLITYIVFISLIALGLSYLIPKLIISVSDVIDQFPVYYNDVNEFIKQQAGPDGKILGINVLNINIFDNISKWIGLFDFNNISHYVEGIYKIGSTIIDIIYAFVVSIYMLLGKERLIKNFGKILSIVIPEKPLITAYVYVCRICDIFYHYVYSMFLDAASVSLLLFIAFTIIGVPYSLLFAVMIGLFNMIPYFGATISGVVVILFTLISNGWIMAVIVAATIIAVQQLDAQLLQPRIVGETIGIRPIYVLLAITIGGGLFGFVGILIGVPLIAAVRMILIDIINWKKKKNEKKEAENIST